MCTHAEKKKIGIKECVSHIICLKGEILKVRERLNRNIQRKGERKEIDRERKEKEKRKERMA